MKNGILKITPGCIALMTGFMVLFSCHVSAQSLTPRQKVQYISAANAAAKEELSKGKVDQARLVLLAVMAPVQSFLPAANQSPIKELFNDYMQMRNKSWDGAPGQLSEPALQAFLNFYDQNKTELFRLGKLFDMSSLPNGKKAYYRRIADILAQRVPAYELAGRWAMKAPPPDQLVANNNVYMVLWKKEVPKLLNHITFGPSLALAHARQRVIPENLKIARDALGRAAGSKDPGTIRIHLHEARGAMELVDTIDAALKKEVDLSALTADVPGIKRQMEQESKRAEVLFDQRVDANRMPSDAGWASGESDKVRIVKQIKNAYAKAFPDEKILQVNLQSTGFSERWETWWERDLLVSAYVGYIKAAVAVKQPNADCRVFIKRFRKNRNADGSWTPLYYHSTVGSFRIREENI